jgi:prepilin-type N-terminal cleavage/methylation domain-containing protein
MRNEKGFTLIELLVVIVILGILAAVVVFAVGGLGDRGQENACKVDKKTLRTAQEARYAADNYGQYAEDEAELVAEELIEAESDLYDTAGTPAGGPYTGYTVTGVGKCVGI